MAKKNSRSEIDRQRLIEENEGIVYHLAALVRQKLPVRYEFDDLVGYGMLGLAEAAKAFQPGKGAKFSTFAFFRVRGAIFDGISESSWMTRAQYRRHVEKTRQSLEPPEDTGSWLKVDGEFVALDKEHYEQLADEETKPSIELDESLEILAQCVENLPRREKNLIQLIYFEGSPLQEAADRVGISKSWASRLHAKIIEKLGFEIQRRQSMSASEKSDEESDSEARQQEPSYAGNKP